MQVGRLIIRHGVSSNISGIGGAGVTTPTRVLSRGELGHAIDTDIVYIGTSNGDKQLLTRVKGNAEVNYRSGDVNITKAHIGLDKVDNTADAEKNVLHAEVATSLDSYGGSVSTPVYFPSTGANKGKPTVVTSIARSLLTGTYDISITGKANTAGHADSAASADLANKLNPSVDAGANDTPVYFSNGLPTVVTSIKRSLLTGTYDCGITGNAATATKSQYIMTSQSVGSVINPVFIQYDSTNQRGVITACNKDASGNHANFVPAVDTNGVMEVGNTIDMHTKTGTTDYDIRLTATAGALNCSGTFTATKVFNAVWNDYADALPREDESEVIAYGMLVAINPKSTMYTKATNKNPELVVGVCSDTYGHLLGGEPDRSEAELLKKYVPVAVAGNVKVYVVGKIKAGDLITISKYDGIGKKASRLFHKHGTIVGKALESSDNKELKKILMQVMLM